MDSVSTRPGMLRATARNSSRTSARPSSSPRMAEDRASRRNSDQARRAGLAGARLSRGLRGAGLGFVDLTVLMEEMGRAVMPGPFFSTLLGGLAILEAGSDAQKKEWLTKIGGGRGARDAGVDGPNARWDAAGVTTTAKASGGAFTLSGTKLFVPTPTSPRRSWSSRARARARIRGGREPVPGAHECPGRVVKLLRRWTRPASSASEAERRQRARGALLGQKDSAGRPWPAWSSGDGALCAEMCAAPRRSST